MAPDKKYERFAIATGAAGLAGNVWINAKKFFIVPEKPGAREQRGNEQTAGDDPKDKNELSVILHTQRLFQLN
jgi:hypothetical protein